MASVNKTELLAILNTIDLTSLTKAQLEGIIRIANEKALLNFAKAKRENKLCPDGQISVITNGVGRCIKTSVKCSPGYKAGIRGDYEKCVKSRSPRR